MSPIVPMTSPEPPKQPVLDLGERPCRHADLDLKTPATKVVVTGMTLINPAERQLLVDNPDGIDHATIARNIRRASDAEDTELESSISVFDD